jgi:hypothetical protein
MRTARLFGLAGLAAAMISVVAAQSASAVPCPEAGNVTLCFKLVAAAAGKYGFTTEQTAETLLEVAALELHIVCTNSTGKGEFNQPTVLGGENLKIEAFVIKFTGCTLLPPREAACEVNPGTAGLITTNAMLGSIDEEILKIALVAAKETELAPIVLKSKTGMTCPIAGTLALTGEQEVKLLEPSIDGLTEPLEALEAEGKLKVGANEAKFKTKAGLKLENKMEFTIELA